MKSIVDYLEHWTARQPDKCLFSFLDVDGREREAYTYAGFRERTRTLAARLVRGSGLRRGDRVLLVYPPGLEIIAAFFACARVGVVPVPVYPPTPANPAGGLSKLAFVARDCTARAALGTGLFRDLHAQYVAACKDGPPPGFPDLPRLDFIATDEGDDVRPDPVADDPGSVLFLQYTSGSTSDPKGVVVSHENLIHNALAAIDHVPIAVSWLPQYHDMGLIGSYIFPVIHGGTTYGFEPRDFLRRPLLWLETVGRVRATGTASPNFGFEYCLREDKVPSARLPELDLSSLRLVANASEPVRADTYERFVARFAPCGLRPAACIAAYGLAENTLAVTYSGRRIATVDKRLLQQGRLRFANARTGADNRLRLVSCGTPVPGVDVRIVDLRTRMPLGERQLGEIWVAGASVAQGYWNRPELSRDVFGNAFPNAMPGAGSYLRTGDLGFLDDEELFVCGRIKDVVIIRGVNYYPQDIEAIVEAASAKVRTGGTAAFAVESDGEALVVVAEVRDPDDLPDPAAIVHALRTQYYVEPRTIAFAPPGSIAKTTSGKVARGATRQRWLDGDLPVIAMHTSAGASTPSALAANPVDRLRSILDRHALTGSEPHTLPEMGIDSIALVSLLDELRELLADHGLGELVDLVDLPLLQQVTVAELAGTLDRWLCEGRPSAAMLRGWLASVAQQRAERERAQMAADAELDDLGLDALPSGDPRVDGVLVTGATGFLGPFLLHGLLRLTTCTCFAVVRAADPAHGMNRIRAALRRAGLWTPDLERMLRERMRVVCGDLSLPGLGLASGQWEALSREVRAVFHCAALVNYSLAYDALRPHNVEATRELLRFAATGVRKEFHYVSTTLIFGWTTLPLLVESDDNDAMANLDFGYAQSKWVAEQLVLAAERQGLAVRIYRTSTLSASTGGVGNRDDIVVRLIAFMLNHGLAVDSTIQISFVPVDIAADNMVAIFAGPGSAGRTLHVTADRYCNMPDITSLIAREYGYRFTYHSIPGFVAELNRRCGRDDPLYPLLEFINRSHAKVALMQGKRYDNTDYRAARSGAPGSRSDPPLATTVDFVMTYLRREELLVRDVPGRESRQDQSLHASGRGDDGDEGSRAPTLAVRER